MHYMCVAGTIDMRPFGVTIPATVPQRSEIPEGLMNYLVYMCGECNSRFLRIFIDRRITEIIRIVFLRCLYKYFVNYLQLQLIENKKNTFQFM